MTSQQALDQAHDPYDDEIDVNPFEIFNPLDAFSGLDYLPIAAPATVDDCQYGTTNKLVDLLKTIRSRSVRKMASGSSKPFTTPEPYESEKQEFHKTAGPDLYYQPLPLFCYFYLNLTTVQKPSGVGCRVQDVIDIMTGDEPVPEALKDPEHAAFTMAEEISVKFIEWWFMDNLRSGTLSKFRKSISKMLDGYPKWDTFSRLELMGLSRLPQFYSLEDLPRERILDGAVDLFGKFGTFDRYEIKSAKRKTMTLKAIESTLFKSTNRLWFATESNERVYLESSSRDNLQFLFVNELVKSGLDIKIELENITLKVKEEWCPYRIIVAEIINYDSLKIIKKG